jgi:hypothetical protein
VSTNGDTDQCLCGSGLTRCYLCTHYHTPAIFRSCAEIMPGLWGVLWEQRDAMKFGDASSALIFIRASLEIWMLVLEVWAF